MKYLDRINKITLQFNLELSSTTMTLTAARPQFMPSSQQSDFKFYK